MPEGGTGGRKYKPSRVLGGGGVSGCGLVIVDGVEKAG